MSIANETVLTETDKIPVECFADLQPFFAPELWAKLFTNETVIAETDKISVECFADLQAVIDPELWTRLAAWAGYISPYLNEPCGAYRDDVSDEDRIVLTIFPRKRRVSFRCYIVNGKLSDDISLYHDQGLSKERIEDAFNPEPLAYVISQLEKK